MSDNKPGRSELLDLLALSDGVDRFTVPPGPNAEAFQVLGTFAGRSRRLARSVLLLLDEGHDIEAGMLERVLMETVVTLQWIGLDWSAHITAWRLADAEERLRWDDDYAKSHNGERLRRAEGRVQIQAVRDRMTARGAGAYPKFWQRCKEVELRVGLTPTWNALLYKRSSHGAIHPSAMAIQRLIDHVDERGAHIDARGPETRNNDYPYEWAALWLQIALHALAQTAPDFFRWRAEVDVIGERLRAGVEARGE